MEQYTDRALEKARFAAALTGNDAEPPSNWQNIPKYIRLGGSVTHSIYKLVEVGHNHIQRCN